MATLQDILRRSLANEAIVLRKAGVQHATASLADLPMDLHGHVRTARTDYLLLLEHTPVYTLGRRDDSAAIGAAMSAPNVDIFQTKRGGLLTYHGPGQLVGYPILDLGLLKVRHLWH